MDISEQYIIMCEEATEIQLVGKKMQPDGSVNQKDYWVKKESGDLIWLPKQDQLQALIPSAINGQFVDEVSLILQELSVVLTKNPFVDTMEKTWLVYVMKKIYGKTFSIKTNKWNTI